MLHVFGVDLLFRDPLVKEVCLESEVILVLQVGLEDLDRKAKEYEFAHNTVLYLCFCSGNFSIFLYFYVFLMITLDSTRLI